MMSTSTRSEAKESAVKLYSPYSVRLSIIPDDANQWLACPDLNENSNAWRLPSVLVHPLTTSLAENLAAGDWPFTRLAFDSFPPCHPGRGQASIAPTRKYTLYNIPDPRIDYNRDSHICTYGKHGYESPEKDSEGVIPVTPAVFACSLVLRNAFEPVMHARFITFFVRSTAQPVSLQGCLHTVLET